MKDIPSPLYRAQKWHMTDHGGDPILGPDFAYCTACDPMWSPRPNPFWVPAAPLSPPEDHQQ